MDEAIAGNGRFRVERDALGDVRVPESALYGPQTARAASWSFTRHKFPSRVVRALALVKACAARVHGRRGDLPATEAAAIERAAIEVAEGAHDAQFVVDLFQTGSGTSSNMNANEVIANRARQLLATSGDDAAVHPNDDVNQGQSSNDVVPSATQLALCVLGHEQLLPALDALVERLHVLADTHWHELRDGRTHLMRATPLRFGQQFRGQADQCAAARAEVARALDCCAELPLGGTAVGTGVGCPPGFAADVCRELAGLLGVDVRETRHHLAQGSLDAIARVVATLRGAATTLYKLVDDLRWQASSIFGELELPAMQPGSSIMPGKINPVVCEAVLMACARVFGHDATVAFANTQGRFELNTMIPLVADAALDATELLAGAAAALRRHVLDGLRVAPAASARVRLNPALATGLAAVVGYDRAGEIAKQAELEGRAVRDVAKDRLDLPDEELDRLLDPAALAGEGGRERADARSGTDSPEAILADAMLSRERKVALLRELAYDARECAVATEEGMGGPPDADLVEILRALAALGAGEAHDGDAKQ
ncbi:MAG: aspartate ammonia-lyase [Planctomycetes bacterium]|nr:aspartate ammonia-lyase [Planctomycetota bacterium]